MTLEMKSNIESNSCNEALKMKEKDEDDDAK